MKSIILSLTICLTLFRCSDKPEVQPSSNYPLSVYPSPATQFFYVSVNNQSNQIYNLKVFDVKGEIMLSENVAQGLQDFNVSLSGKPKGLYHVVLDTDKSRIIKKVVKV